MTHHQGQNIYHFRPSRISMLRMTLLSNSTPGSPRVTVPNSFRTHAVMDGWCQIDLDMPTKLEE